MFNDDTHHPTNDASYEVGYGKPPEFGKFKPGQSGNTKGRPKGSKNTRTILEAIFLKKESITINGKSYKMTPYEIMLMQIKKAAYNGDLKAIREACAMLTKSGLIMEDEKQEEAQNHPVGAVVVPRGLTAEEWKAKYENLEADK